MKMSSVELEIEGVKCEVSHPTLKLTKSKLPVGDVINFRCTCGRKTLSVSKEHIKSAGPAFGVTHPIGFMSVKSSVKISRERQEFEDDQTLDAIAYWQKHRKWEVENASSFPDVTATSETSTSVTCPLCSAKHFLTVKFSFPSDVQPNWRFPSLIEVFEKRGITNNKRSLDVITIATRGREDPETYLKQVYGLSQDKKAVPLIIEALTSAIEEAGKFQSELAKSWKRDLIGALKEEGEIVKRKLGAELNFHLEVLKDAAETERRMPKETEKPRNYIAGF
jgi:hypothetical protein